MINQPVTPFTRTTDQNVKSIEGWKAFLLAVLIISIIGIFDYQTGVEFGFSFFYLIPIAIFAAYKSSNRYFILFCALLAASFWFSAEFLEYKYSHIFFPIWNASVRLLIFGAIGMLIYYYKEKDKKLKILNEKLKAINEEKNKFIGIAAHDTRSPLGVIYALSDIIIVDYKNQLNNEIIEILEIIKNTSKKSLNLIENLLDVSKIESGKLVLNVKSQDFIPFIKNQIYISQLLAQKKDIQIELKTDFNSLLLDFDDHYFSEIVDNLLSNAIKYSNKNTVVQICLHVENEHLIVEVTDQGIGISQEDQINLFKYFQTTSSRPTDGEESTGLGLAISKQIILLHQGTIGVKSEKGKGSTFYFRLPLKQKE